jgi:hypothetical protein
MKSLLCPINPLFLRLKFYADHLPKMWFGFQVTGSGKASDGFG